MTVSFNIKWQNRNKGDKMELVWEQRADPGEKIDLCEVQPLLIYLLQYVRGEGDYNA